MVTVAASGLGKRYRDRTVLSDATFSLHEGTLTVLAGENGAGKTTLLKRMVGMVSGTGETTFAGRRWSELEVPRREVGVYLGTGSFHAGVTAEGHLRLIATAAQAPSAAVDLVLEQFGLGAHRHVKVSRLSLGLRQRLGLASAVLPDPPVLLLDEPFSALDPGEAAEVYDWLADQVRERRTVLASTHHLARIEPYVTDILFMSAGRIVADGPVEHAGTRYQVDAVSTIACTAAITLAAELVRIGVEVRVRSGEILVASGVGPEQVRAAAAVAGVTVHALWTEPPGLSSLYEALVR